MKFDLHVHSEGSFDSFEKLEHIIAAAKKAGLDGVAVTDHNVASISHRDADSDGFILIPGAEYATDAGHLLTYFITAPLDEGLKKDEKGRYPWREIVRRAHDMGGLVFLAHPYAPKFNRDEAIFAELDGIEGYNARVELSRERGANLRARSKAKELGLPLSAGSDGHSAAEVGSAYFECEVTAEACEDKLAEIKSALKEGRGKIYGGRSSSIYKIKSGWYKTVKIRQWKRIPLMLLRTLRGLVLAVKPKKVPEFIAHAREEATNDSL